MRCPQCSCMDDKVIETRVSREGDTIRRRRECASCAYRFTTKEAVVPAEIMVVKRDASREEFNPEKLRAGIRHACWKRSVSE
jgi:transcriptional repressor NrdR